MPDDIVICFLRTDGTVLLHCRDSGASNEGWDVPSTTDSCSANEQVARRLCGEWIPEDEATLVRVGDPVAVGASRLHPFLFDCEPSDGTGEREEDDGAEWVHAPEIRHRQTPTARWRAYRAVSPTVESIRTDRTHGSAYISVRALEVLRDRASKGADWSTLVECATDLLEARPSMAAVANRINRAMSIANETASAPALEASTRERIDRAVEADQRAASRAAERIEGTVVTLSRSGTVEDALVTGQPDRVIVLESRPDREGVDVADALAETLDVTLTLEAAVSHVMDRVDTLFVGADTVLADGSVVNKVGTRTAAVAAAREDVPVYAVAAADKISPSEEPILETVDREAITENEAVAVDCPLFDRTPPDLVTGVITEEGLLDAATVENRAREHERHSGWKEPNGSTK